MRKMTTRDDDAAEYRAELASMSTRELELVLEKITAQIAKAEQADADEPPRIGANAAKLIGSQSRRAIVRDAMGLISETVTECFDEGGHPLGLRRVVVERDADGMITDLIEFAEPWSPREDR